MQPEEKVVSMDEYRKPKEHEAPEASRTKAKAPRDMGRIALFVAVIAILMAGILFYRANQSLNIISKDVTGITAKIGFMDARMAELETLPAKSKRMVTNTMIQEMAQRVSYLSTQVDDKEQAAKLLQAMELLRQARPAQ